MLAVVDEQSTVAAILDELGVTKEPSAPRARDPATLFGDAPEHDAC